MRRILLAFTALTLVAAATPAAANPERASVGAPRLTDSGDGETVALTLAPGESLDRLLARVGIPKEQRHAALTALRAAAPGTPRAGDRIGLNIARTADGSADLNALFLEPDPRSDLTLVATDDLPLATGHGAERGRRTVRGTVGADFAATLADIGVPGSVIDDAIESLAYEPETTTSPEAKSRFHIVYRTPTAGEEPRLERVTLTAPGGREHRVVPYASPRSALPTEGGFLEPPASAAGRAEAFPAPAAYAPPLAFATPGETDPRLPKGDPVPGGRLTSPWGWRIHPVLKRQQFHKGVDFSAPAGTPVLATADGVVSFVGRRGNYGKLIRLQHPGEIATAYAHLQGFANGLKAGARVHQGQIIGYVGRSGLATGNHLYYEVYANGKQIDPLGGVIVKKHMSEAEIKRLRRALAKDGTTID